LRFGKRESLHRAGRVELDEVLLENIEALSRPLVQESSEELTLALEALQPDYALVLRMRFLDEMPLKRIAAFLGVPLSTVKWRVHQGKKRLREELLKIRGE
jgi:RNA polymerase sigma-70 factor (ECF subfamily)